MSHSLVQSNPKGNIRGAWSRKLDSDVSAFAIGDEVMCDKNPAIRIFFLRILGF